MESKVTRKEKLCYALANLGNIPVQTIIGSYLLIFYTNIVGLNPAAVATLFLIARILDGLNDPFIGYVIDHLPTTKHGHFRPTLMIGSILCSLNFLLLWFGPMMATSGKLVIAYISYLLIGVLFPVMDISLNSMLPVMTSDMDERNKLSSLKGFIYLIGMLALNVAAPVIVGDMNKKGGFIVIVLVAACIIAVFSVIGAAGLKERVTVTKDQKYRLRDLFRILFQKPVAITFLATLINVASTYVMNTALAYFFTYVIPDLKLMGLVSGLQIVTILPATILATGFIKKIGKKKTYIIALLIMSVAPLFRLINVTNIPLLIITTLIAGFGMGTGMPLSYGIQADNTDYVELSTGYRAEAAVAALSSFVAKCAMGIGGAIPGYLLASAGFNASASSQPAGVNGAIIACVIIVPSVMNLVATGIIGFYPLTKEKLEEQNAKIAALRAQGK